jgi:hypothetical protein
MQLDWTCQPAAYPTKPPREVAATTAVVPEAAAEQPSGEAAGEPAGAEAVPAGGEADGAAAGTAPIAAADGAGTQPATADAELAAAGEQLDADVALASDASDAGEQQPGSPSSDDLAASVASGPPPFRIEPASVVIKAGSSVKFTVEYEAGASGCHAGMLVGRQSIVGERTSADLAVGLWVQADKSRGVRAVLAGEHTPDVGVGLAMRGGQLIAHIVLLGRGGRALTDTCPACRPGCAPCQMLLPPNLLMHITVLQGPSMHTRARLQSPCPPCQCWPPSSQRQRAWRWIPTAPCAGRCVRAGCCAIRLFLLAMHPALLCALSAGLQQ